LRNGQQGADQEAQGGRLDQCRRQGRSRKFKHPAKSGHVVVPHPRKDIPIGTLRNIYRQAGWIWK
jgi:predicted RNA binding protein YcfA (HicA-like mRNA interferase family)